MTTFGANMESNQLKYEHYETILRLISSHETGIGWYLIERALGRRSHSISQDGILMELLREMENNGLIQLIPDNLSQNSVYIATEKGKKIIESSE
jgi:DNA-binding HxlR family transcriptional regulator